jgi:hypothetical protein
LESHPSYQNRGKVLNGDRPPDVQSREVVGSNPTPRSNFSVDILEKADTIDYIMKTTKIRKHRIEATLGKDFEVEAGTEVYKVGTRFDGRNILKHGGYRVVTGHGSSFLIPFEYFNKFIEKWEQADTEVVRGRTLTKIEECEADVTDNFKKEWEKYLDKKAKAEKAEKIRELQNTAKFLRDTINDVTTGKLQKRLDKVTKELNKLKIG